mgnify:CR=1 FL=1
MSVCHVHIMHEQHVAIIYVGHLLFVHDIVQGIAMLISLVVMLVWMPILLYVQHRNNMQNKMP